MSTQLETKAVERHDYREETSQARNTLAVPFLISGALFLLHLVTMYRYGYFRDEFCRGLNGDLRQIWPTLKLWD
ncbi:MAG TPA: hypothetical protein VI756_22870 [Blastocatellia bacterium]